MGLLFSEMVQGIPLPPNRQSAARGTVPIPKSRAQGPENAASSEKDTGNIIAESQDFERLLLENLKVSIEQGHLTNGGGGENPEQSSGAEEEIQFVQREMERGVVYLLGESDVVATAMASLLKKIVIIYGYSFLRKKFRQGERLMTVPQSRLLRIG